MPTRYERQERDVEKAIEDYNKSTQSRERDLSVQSAAKNIMDRRNVLDKLDDDLKSAGQTEMEKKIYGK